ncbi:MAG: saccharopine dehydrogenase C-terminal domain-containing protein [Chitinophagaceae bacterium]
MKQILLFGAGKSATVLIDYLLAHAQQEGWELTVADANLQLATDKIKGSPFGHAVAADILDASKREALIRHCDIAISMLPPVLHREVAKDCIRFSKHLLTASYVDEELKQLEPAIRENNLLFLCEMGLDPGIDHMSAMQLIDGIRSSGGRLTSFRSHCGGLVAPESDDNPWHYKISWNPRNIVLAGKAGALYREDGKDKRLPYEALFNQDTGTEVPGLGYLSWYANRDSLSYLPLYGLQDIPTFIRTTLRHPDFMYGWQNLIDLKLTDETLLYDTGGKTLAELFKEHLDRHHFREWLQRKLEERFARSKDMLQKLTTLVESEKKSGDLGLDVPGSFMAADAKGNLEEVDVEAVKNRGAAFLAHNLHLANLTLKQLFYLGLDDMDTLVNKGRCSAADILQFALETKLGLQPGDKDMIVMLHELEYERDNTLHAVISSLIVTGEDSLHTAMAKTVGLPLAIAAKLILNGTLQLRGLHIPTRQEIYQPVLAELAVHGIKFQEQPL